MTFEGEETVRKIIHVDMDAFYASVEQRDDPRLRGKPVIVGGQPNGRGVVAACSYEAREFGVRSAMPSSEAVRRCPDAIFLKPRFEHYKSVSSQLREVFHSFTPLVEPLSLDEAYLDVTNSALFGGSAVLLASEIRVRILERTGLTASAGVSYNKFLAKIASDYDKPDGLFCITPAEGEVFVAGLSVGKIHGVGKVTQARMHQLGIRAGSDLKTRTLEELRSEFGKAAEYYYLAARGVDHRPVRSSRLRRSIGSERTFSENLQKREQMLPILESLGEELLSSLQKQKLRASTLNIKARFGDFTTVTRAYTRRAGSIDSEVFESMAPCLLDRALAVKSESYDQECLPRHKGVRLLGVSFSSLAKFDDTTPRQLRLDI